MPSKLSSTYKPAKVANLAEVLVDRYGFSPEEAKVIAKQYVKDVGALATGVAMFSVIL